MGVITASWFTGFVVPALVALAKQLLAQYLRNKAMVDSGAAQQRSADSITVAVADAKARSVQDEVSHLSDADVAAELARRLSGRH